MADPSPVNSACNCCTRPPEISVSLQYVSVGQECSSNQCGELPCTSDIFDEYPPNNEPPVKICSPNFGSLSRKDQCIGKKYFTKTESSTQLGFLGRIKTTEYSINPNPDPEYPEETACISSETCSGSYTVTNNAISTADDGSGTYQSVETFTWPPDCSGAIFEVTSCSGSSVRYDDEGQIVCSSSVTGPPDCSWEGSGIFGPVQSSCVGLSFDPQIFNPPIENKVEITYTNPNDEVTCNPIEIPDFPEFKDCVPEGVEPPEPIEYQSGQGEGSEAYYFQQIYYPQTKSYQKIRYRVEHTPTPSCFLQVWFRERIQKWKLEDCDTGFAGDPPRTQPWTESANCNEYPCLERWSTDGSPIYQEKDSYMWRGSGYPCFNDKNKLYTKCENKIYSSSPKTATASENQSITIEFKYSEVEGYVPNWPDENGSQGCKPNGYPIANPEECPEFNS